MPLAGNPADDELGRRVPVFRKGDPDLGRYDAITEVSASVFSTSCKATSVATSPERVKAIRALRGKALERGADGLLDLQCRVSGSGLRGTATFRWCVQLYGREALQPTSNVPIRSECRELREHWTERYVHAQEWPDDFVMPGADSGDCEYTTQRTAIAIRRAAAQPQ